MKREILYKAKKLNGEWTEGWFTKVESGNLIVPCLQRYREHDTGDYIESVEINGETLCQAIGLTDKNGKKIFGGDDFLSNGHCQVYWNKDKACFYVAENIQGDEADHVPLFEYDTSQLILTGKNIHDK